MPPGICCSGWAYWQAEGRPFQGRPSAIRRDCAARRRHEDLFFERLCRFFAYPSSAIFRPIRTPMMEAIISPRVQPEESPRQ